MARPEDDLRLKRERYMEWLLTPKDERQPPTKAAMARELERSEKTLRDWEQMPEFRAEWEKRAREVMGGPERLKAVADAMYAQALDADSRKQVQAAKMFAELIGAHSPPPLKVEATLSLSALSDEELDALIAQTASAVRESRAAVDE